MEEWSRQISELKETMKVSFSFSRFFLMRHKRFKKIGLVDNHETFLEGAKSKNTEGKSVLADLNDEKVQEVANLEKDIEVLFDPER